MSAAPARRAADATTAREYAWAAYWSAGHAADLIREAQYVAERALTEVWASPVAEASDRDAAVAGLVRSAHRALTAACMAEDAAARAAAAPPASPEAATTVWVARAAAALTRAATQTAQAAAGAAHVGHHNAHDRLRAAVRVLAEAVDWAESARAEALAAGRAAEPLVNVAPLPPWVRAEALAAGRAAERHTQPAGSDQ